MASKSKPWAVVLSTAGGPSFIPEHPRFAGRTLGPLTLAQLMDHIHMGSNDEPSQRWSDWKAAYPEVFPA